MVILYSVKDLIPVKIKDITLVISPMKYRDRQNLELLMRQSDDLDKTLEAAKYAIKCSVKAIKGLNDHKGDSYKLSFDDDGYLSDTSVEDLLSIPLNNEVISVCTSLLNGIPESFLNPFTGKPMDGVELIKEGVNDPLVVGA